MAVKLRIVEVALPVPLRRSFDYLLPADQTPVMAGSRVRVPLGRRSLIGVVLAAKDTSVVPRSQLRELTEVLDREPILPSSVLRLIDWAAQYYHHPVGEVVAAALPTRVKTQGAVVPARLLSWHITTLGACADPRMLGRATLQRRVLLALQSAPAGLPAPQLAEISGQWRKAIDALTARGWVASQQHDPLSSTSVEPVEAPLPTEAQTLAAKAIVAASGFAPFLLYGVTGSGKTEVYLRVAEQVLARGQQILVLVPEIALTPQLVTRFRRRLSGTLAALHSNLSDLERAHAWTAAREGKVQVIVGTRSAIFTPLPRLGAIVVDEEHDSSYVQQEGFRYSARDVAIMRAKLDGIPVVLGSATPSLETFNRVQQDAYKKLVLPGRAAGAELPTMELLDMRRLAVEEGLSHPLRTAIAATLQKGEQSLLFLNRRGFAPVWMCYGCGWLAPCGRCDARLTFHRAAGRLRCHHCGAEHEAPRSCPACKSADLHAFGEGTERVESSLARIFPGARIVRIDRDSTRAKGSLEEKLDRARRGDADILVGTQMLSKGHDFPNVTLVGVINADQGLYGSDFRAAERLVQQIVQVSGRAGRAEKRGHVLIQTYHPTHPLFAALRANGYEEFARYALEDRRQSGFPPFSHFALLRAESTQRQAPLAFLRNARSIARRLAVSGVQVMEPVPSPMERRAGRYRAQLLVQSSKRKPLHAMLDAWTKRLEQGKPGRRVRWSLDVDPVDMS